MKSKDIENRLDYLRGEIKAERISTSEIAELQSLSEYIDEYDMLLREWAGVGDEDANNDYEDTATIELNDIARQNCEASPFWNSPADN